MSPTCATTTESRWRILVVNSDPGGRERLYDLLTRHGYVVTTTTTGEVSREALRHQWPHLVIVATRTHRDHDLTLTDHIRSFDEQLPIILLGSPDEEPPDGDTIRRVQAYVQADATEDHLLAAVSRWMPRQWDVAPIDYPGSILLVDDEPELLRNLEEFLSPRGCAILTALSGESALEQLAAHQPALVILDIKMPGMDGLLTLKRIKALRPTLPVVMATAVEGRASMAQAFTLGAYEYITKPYNLEMLADLLRYLKRQGLESPILPVS